MDNLLLNMTSTAGRSQTNHFGASRHSSIPPSLPRMSGPAGLVDRLFSQISFLTHLSACSFPPSPPSRLSCFFDSIPIFSFSHLPTSDFSDPPIQPPPVLDDPPARVGPRNFGSL